MVKQKDRWGELDSKLDELSYSLIEWNQFFEDLINNGVPLNSKPIFGNLTAKKLIQQQKKRLLAFKKDLAAIKETKPKSPTQVKEEKKYCRIGKESEEILELFKIFLERSAHND
jgi:hypothetical protein